MMTHEMPCPSAVAACLVHRFVHLVAFLMFASDSIAIGEASSQRLSPIHFSPTVAATSIPSRFGVLPPRRRAKNALHYPFQQIKPVGNCGLCSFVRPAKAGAFSGSESRQGNSQKPCSSDSREERNRGPEASRQKPPSGWRASHRAAAEANADVASKEQSPEGPTCETGVKAAWERHTLANVPAHFGGVGSGGTVTRTR